MGVQLAVAPPNVVGPTWRRTIEGQWWLPQKTLGWAIIDWLYEYVRSPGGPHAGEGFIPTMEQARFLLWWYAIDEHGDYAYREGVLRRLKGWGKDPFAAALALVEMCGPVAFSHFDPITGQAVGKRRHAAWIQVAAVSQEQTKNTFKLFPIMVSKKLREVYGIEVNKFVLYSAEGGTIEAVTSSPASMEGNRPTFVIKNETQWWGRGPDGAANDGIEMSDVIDGNLDKTDGARALSICNAHVPGTDTVAELAWDQYRKEAAGDSPETGLLYDALEAPASTPVILPSPKDDPEGYEIGVWLLTEGVYIARGDSTWLPVKKIVQSILDGRKLVSESRRKFLNQINAAEDSWISPQEWNLACRTEESLRLQPGTRITMGFDGSKSNDWTALVACRVSDGFLFLLGAWDPKKCPGEEIDREMVDAVVRSAKEKYDVVGFRADVREFESYVDSWGQLFKRSVKVNASPANPVAFDMRGNTKKFALDCERFSDAVLSVDEALGEYPIAHDGNLTLSSHVTNAKKYPTQYDAIAIRKATKDSSRKIDAAVCAVLAYGSRQDYLMSKKNRPGGAVIIR